MLTTDMLTRLKAITDVFYEVDGISFEEAVAINEADANPASNIEIYEEMTRVYKEFCKSRPLSQAEKEEVYKVLLLRSFCKEHESIMRLNISELSYAEAIWIIRQYKLEAKPVVLYVE